MLLMVVVLRNTSDINDFGDKIEDRAIDEDLRMHSTCGVMHVGADYERNRRDDEDAYIPRRMMLPD